MKKMVFLVLFIAVSGLVLFAQPAAPAPAPGQAPGPGAGPRGTPREAPRGTPREAPTPPESTTVSGTLGFYNGRIAVSSGTDVYVVRGIDRLVGFVDGFKEGAQVSMEGFVIPSRREGQSEKAFALTKLTFNGKTYEFGKDAGPRMGMGKERLHFGRPQFGGPQQGRPQGGKGMFPQGGRMMFPRPGMPPQGATPPQTDRAVPQQR